MVCSAGHTSCPMCRRNLRGLDPITATPDAAAAALIAEAAPQEELARRQLEAAGRLQLIVGNLYEEVPDHGGNTNKWTMYVTLQGENCQHAKALIDKVVYNLHWTFQPSVVTAHAPNFSLCRYGWGTFAVKCDIHWKSQLGLPPSRVDHYLVFDGEGGRTAGVTVDVDPVVLYQLTSGRARRLLPETSTELLEVVVGNRVADYDDSEDEDEDSDIQRRWIWTLYVHVPGFNRSIARMIERVTYKLHPTFTPQKVTKTSPSLEFSAVGWGTFPVTCRIHWNNALCLATTTVVHELCFEPGGGRTATTVGVASSRLQQFQQVQRQF